MGQDTDGTMTPIDLQMDWVVSKKKYDFIGKRSLYRSDTMREDRKQMVGLLTDCLLYTSDAADEEDSVDLGGRRIIKKKKNKSS